MVLPPGLCPRSGCSLGTSRLLSDRHTPPWLSPPAPASTFYCIGLCIYLSPLSATQRQGLCSAPVSLTSEGTLGIERVRQDHPRQVHLPSQAFRTLFPVPQCVIRCPKEGRDPPKIKANTVCGPGEALLWEQWSSLEGFTTPERGLACEGGSILVPCWLPPLSREGQIPCPMQGVQHG